jgi:hypothetical protein
MPLKKQTSTTSFSHWLLEEEDLAKKKVDGDNGHYI